MARKASSRSSQLSDEARRSLLTLFFFGVAALVFLSFVGLAGQAGIKIDAFLDGGFGIVRIFLVALFVFLGVDLILQKEVVGSVSFWLAVLLGFLGLSGLAAMIGLSGGVLSLFFTELVVGQFGSLVAVLGAGAFVFTALILVGNLSLRQLVEGPLRWVRADDVELPEEEKPVTFVGGEEDEEEVEEEAVDEESVEEEEGEGSERSSPHRPVAVPAETVMTTSERRTITVPLDLLDDRRSEPKAGDINRNQEVIVKTLEQFGIPVEMADVRVGPTVTQYAFRPAHGVKLARIVALQNDLALALAAHPIRIEAPIPGKALVGVEVPNQTIARVSLREIMESEDFAKRKSSFSAPLGRDISGAVPTLPIERAPHMLVAGATGSGKSVCLNTIILSLLYQNGPDDLKLIMVDPKRVELGVYAGIPHLLVPPITKAEEAVNALKWAVREMDRRLDYLAKFGARDIDAYNAKAAERMPRVIIIIDELADLMIQNKREVEGTIVRIAQMARAAGIHLILATQRPSVDVITGTIKANIPTRLAFAVASQVDSKTILDISGAEKLLGRGDMLMSTPELSKPRRVQGAFVADTEIERVVAFLKKESEPEYNYQITEGGNGAGGVSLDPADSDPLLDDAVTIAIDAGRVSTSYLQRRMKIGYSRAARIVDLMEQLGVVGPADGAKPREVLVSSWPPEDEDSYDAESDEAGEFVLEDIEEKEQV